MANSDDFHNIHYVECPSDDALFSLSYNSCYSVDAQHVEEASGKQVPKTEVCLSPTYEQLPAGYSPLALSSTTYASDSASETTSRGCSQTRSSKDTTERRYMQRTYKCDLCKMQFSQKSNMLRHRMGHGGIKPHECRYCSKRFFRKDQMEEHLMVHIKKGENFVCPVANCNLRFGQHSALRLHLDAHSISSTTPALCKICYQTFVKSKRLLLHYQTKHNDSDSVPNAEPIPSAPAEDVRVTESYSPATEGFSPSLEALSPNVQNEQTSSECSAEEWHEVPSAASALLVPEVEPEDKLLMWSAVDSNGDEYATYLSDDSGISCTISDISDAENCKEERLECMFCGLVFLDRTLHLLHKGLHSESDPWRCNLCGYRCDDKYLFTTHVITRIHNY